VDFKAGAASTFGTFSSDLENIMEQPRYITKAPALEKRPTLSVTKQTSLLPYKEAIKKCSQTPSQLSPVHGPTFMTLVMDLILMM
jgi:hypothetical protein